MTAPLHQMELVYMFCASFYYTYGQHVVFDIFADSEMSSKVLDLVAPAICKSITYKSSRPGSW